MILRDYQSETVTKIQESLKLHQGTMAVLPCRSGKTVIFSDVIEKLGVETVAIAHRSVLIGQMSRTLAAFGIRHQFICAEATRTNIIKTHYKHFGKSFFDPSSNVTVCSINTLKARKSTLTEWASRVRFAVTDEGHHIVKDNMWGEVLEEMFPTAKYLAVTATPCRGDGKGLGRNSHGLMDNLILGPEMRDLINRGHIADYKIYVPPNNLDLTNVNIGPKSGEYSKKGLKMAVQKSTITGDIVEHYRRFGKNLPGITFCIDVNMAKEVCADYIAAGIPAKVMTGESTDTERTAITDGLANRTILQIVAVDIVSEGFDLDGIYVVTMARPTASFGLFVQQFCLDPETEILTDIGWKGCHEVNNDTNVYGYDIKTGNCRILPISNKIERPMYSDETMYSVDAAHLNMCVSNKHDLVVKSNSGTCKNWHKFTADKVAKRKSLYKLPVAAFGEFKGAGLSESELMLIGWYLSDGSINKKNNSLSISQSIKKTHHIKSIRDSIDGCNFKYGTYIHKRINCPETHNDLIRFSISKGDARGSHKDRTGWGRLEKWLHKNVPICFDDMTRDEFKILLKAINLGDGNNNHNSIKHNKNNLTIACGDNKIMADRLQELCVVRGFRCNISIQDYEGRGTWYYLQIGDYTTSTLPGCNVQDGDIKGRPYKRSRLHESTYRPEYVWCVSNEMGTLITRRKGKVVIMGNCRCLNPADDKDRGIIIDAVGNVRKHGVPDKPQPWSLEPRAKKSKQNEEGIIKIRVCGACSFAWEGVELVCPECGYRTPPVRRDGPEFVEGDLHELDEATLARMRGEVIDVEAPFLPTPYVNDIINGRHRNLHIANQGCQVALRDSMAIYAGQRRAQGCSNGDIYRHYYYDFGIDMGTSKSLKNKLAYELKGRIDAHPLCST